MTDEDQMMTDNGQTMTVEDQTLTSELKFVVISTRKVETPKQYVAYKIMVQREGSERDNHPCIIERRYTEFLELYTSLLQEFPTVFSSLDFPKKALIGNFSPEVISSRSSSFTSLLSLLAEHEKVREATSVINFLVKKEQSDAIQLIQDKKFIESIDLLENSFWLLNKILTTRNPQVLRALCLLVACCDAAGSAQTQQYAETALRRFEGVSDADILCYYVPLLQLCVRTLQHSEAQTILEDRLSCMKRRGVKVDGCPTLLDAVLADCQS